MDRTLQKLPTETPEQYWSRVRSLPGMSTSSQPAPTQTQNVPQDTPDYQSFGNSVLDLLKKAQQQGQNRLGQAQKEQVQRSTSSLPGDLSGARLSPSDILGFRRGEANTLEPTIGGIRSQISEATKGITDVKDYLKSIQEEENRQRDDARSVIQNALTVGGADSLKGLDQTELKNLEKKAGFPTGYLEGVTKTLKERELELKKQSSGGDKLLTLSELQAYGLPAGSTLADATGLKPLSQPTRTTLNAITNAIPLVNSISTLVDKLKLPDTTPSATLHGANLQAQSLFPSTEAGQYKAQTNGFLSLIVRALGEKGTLATGDIERIKAAIPGFYDTQTSATNKLNNLRKIMSDVYQKSVAGYYDSEFGASISRGNQTNISNNDPLGIRK